MTAENHRRARGELFWLEQPTYMGQVVGLVYPGEIHDVFSDDGGENWFMIWGPKIKKEWITISEEVIEYETEKKRNWIQRWCQS